MSHGSSNPRTDSDFSLSEQLQIKRETRAWWLGGVAIFFPCMISSGFMPELNVLPMGGWLAIAMVGGGLAGAYATPYCFRGMLSGVLTGAGALLGFWSYVNFRLGIFENRTFWNHEFALVTLISGAPGLMLFMKWARSKPQIQVGQEATTDNTEEG